MSPRIARPLKSPRVLRLKPDLTPAERRAMAMPAPGRVRPSPALPIQLSRPPEKLQWYALTVRPQSEFVALGQLEQRGFDVFLPVERVKVRKNRMQRYERVERQRPILPSMLLAGFPLDCGVPWLHLWDVPRVTGVVGMGDRPVRLQLVNVVALMLRSGGLSRTRNWSAAINDVVEVAEGAFAGFRGTVTELRDGKARVLLFGAGEGLLASIKGPLTVDEGELVEANFASA